jgi:hypothetical protein
MSDLAATLPLALRAPSLNAAAAPPAPPTDPGKTGLAPGIQGDPVIALIAQLNRYRKAKNAPELPLVPGPLTPAIALEALTILRDRLNAANTRLPDPSTAKQLAEIQRLLTASIPMAYLGYAFANIDLITQQLALNANAQGYAPAKAGITADTDPTAPKPLIWPWVVAGVVVLGGGAYWYMRRRAQAPA